VLRPGFEPDISRIQVKSVRLWDNFICPSERRERYFKSTESTVNPRYNATLI